MGPAPAAQAASFKRLYRTRAENRARVNSYRERASDKALTFIRPYLRHGSGLAAP
jgi:hypothetical protein